MAKQEQIACIFCGRSFIREKTLLEKYDSWSIDWKVLQVRDMLPGPGRGIKGKSKEYGWPVIPEESLSILNMIDNSEYSDVVNAIKLRLIKIVKAYIKAGIIKRSELR